MRNCQEITELFERSRMNSVSVSDKIEIRLHGTLCKECRSYFKDSIIMEKILARRFRHNGRFTFSPEEKSRIKNKLNNH